MRLQIAFNRSDAESSMPRANPEMRRTNRYSPTLKTLPSFTMTLRWFNMSPGRSSLVQAGLYIFDLDWARTVNQPTRDLQSVVGNSLTVEYSGDVILLRVRLWPAAGWSVNSSPRASTGPR